MNATLLMEMIAARNSSRRSPGVAEALSRMQAVTDVAQQPSVDDMMASLSARNPMLGMVFRQLAECGAKAKESAGVVIEADAVEVDPVDRRNEMEVAGTSEAGELIELRCQLQTASVELNILRERIDLLAAALGACALCWGQEPACRACRGRGLPGYALPDEALFEELILPALQLLRAHRIKQGRIAPIVPVKDTNVDASSVNLHQSYERGHYNGHR
jgi:hypothetical protein